MKKILLLASAALLVAQGSFAQDKLSLKVSGRGYIDGTQVIQNSDEHEPSGVSISDLRIGVSGKWENWSAKIDLGYAQKKISYKDIYLQYNFKPNSYARIGHYAEPIGIDYMESSGNIKFIDAGIVQQAFAPGRRLGIEYIGWNKGLWVGAGAFDDANFSNKRNGQEAGDGYSLTGRVVYAPMYNPGSIFHIGIATSYRVPTAGSYQDDRIDSYGCTLGSPVISDEFNTASVEHAKHNLRLGTELIAAYNRIAIQSEYMYSNTSRTNTVSDLKSYKAWGAYGQVAIQLIGQPYEYSQSWARLALPEPGSLELAVRFAHVDLEDPEAGLGVHELTTNNGKILQVGRITNQLTVGLNYYYKPFLRFKLDYDNSHLRGMESFNMITGRIQFFF
ncbi:MAG: OprO/OprP family phosphate-selective porin [Prevotella sp.]|jgi:phosphate-selective porin OprO/OprP|nr:OprO/OprP family phosphate-selective porin [Prevotella sp.]MCI2124891.1 OprO/OprP family phosphate-selective porin [Prevotella sp.]